MSLLIHGMPTASTVWLTFRLTSGGMRTRKSFVVNYSSSPPTLAMVMVTFFPLRPSSSLTDNLIKLTWAPESKSRFRCLLTFSDPIISTRMTGRIACLLPATDKYVKAVAEFAASAPCNNGWWKYLHWLPLNDSLQRRLRAQLETSWSLPARFRQLKQPWFALTALKRSLGDIDPNYWHCSVQWVDVLHNQHLWFTIPFSQKSWYLIDV